MKLALFRVFQFAYRASHPIARVSKTLLRGQLHKQWSFVSRHSHEPRTRYFGTMASLQSMDGKTKALIDNAYPQAKEAGDDVVKASSAAFPNVEVCSLPRLTLIQYTDVI